MISIIVPVYNAEKYLRRCLDSIMQQSYKDFEVIIINDGSVDGSAEICADIARENKKVKTITTENRGVSNARNIGLDLAKGEYIAFVDADDYLDIDYLETYIHAVVSTGADIVIGGVQEECCNKSRYKKNKNVTFEHKTVKKLVCSLLDNKSDGDNSYFPQVLGFSCGKLYKKDVIGSIRFDRDLPVREDTLFNANVFLVSNKIVFREFLGYHYVVHETSATGHFRKNCTNELKAFLRGCKELWEKNELSFDSYYVGCLYTYMHWLKLFVMHKDSGFTKQQQIDLIKESFEDEAWMDGFKNVRLSSLNSQYKLLGLLFNSRYAGGIQKICELSQKRR